MRRFVAASPVIAGILIFASQAHAQQAAAPAAAAPGAPMIGEVLVTAQRRSERAIDVPQTVNLVSGERLEKSGITDTMSLGQVVPSFYIAPNGLTVQPTIRGVGSSVTTPGASGTVAAYIDGVYQLAQGTYDFDLTDLEKIEVLKGPQGTLYGRNATGGVVLITTKPPSFKPGGHITVGYGNYNAYSANIYATGPIAPKLAGNFSADYKASDGYFQDIFRNTRVGDKERYAVGGKLLYEINDDAKIVVGLKHSFNSDPNSFASAPLNGNTVARRTPGTVIATKPYDVALTFTPSIKNHYDQASLAADFGNDKVHFSFISGANFNTEKRS